FEAFDAVQRRDLAHLAAGAGDAADLVVARPGAVAEEVGGAAVRRPLRRGDLPAARGQALRRLARHHRVQVREAAFLGQQPQRAAAGQPAEVVEVPVDPGVVGQPVRRLEAGGLEIDGGDPAVLVVDGARHQRRLAAFGRPLDGLDADGALALERLLPGLLAQVGQRVAVDAGQGRQRQVAHAAVAQVDQLQRLAQRRIAADAGAHVLDFLVTGLGDVPGHLAGAALVGALGFGDDDQPAAIRRHRTVDDLDAFAEVDRRDRAGRVGLAVGFGLLALGVAEGALARQGAAQAQLVFAQGVRRRRRVRILAGAGQGD